MTESFSEECEGVNKVREKHYHLRKVKYGKKPIEGFLLQVPPTPLTVTLKYLEVVYWPGLPSLALSPVHHPLASEP